MIYHNRLKKKNKNVKMKMKMKIRMRILMQNMLKKSMNRTCLILRVNKKVMEDSNVLI